MASHLVWLDGALTGVRTPSLFELVNWSVWSLPPYSRNWVSNQERWELPTVRQRDGGVSLGGAWRGGRRPHSWMAWWSWAGCGCWGDSV